MSSRYTQTLGTHHWTPAMEDAEVANCGDCPDCGAEGSYNNLADEPSDRCTPDFAGDGERLSLWWKCSECGASWTDYFKLTTREVIPGPEVELSPRGLGFEQVDNRSTIWIDGGEQKLYSVEEGLEIMADIHAESVARERV